MFAFNNLHMTDMRAKSILFSLALHYILYIIAYNAYAITMDNLQLLSSGIRLQGDRATPTV